MNDANEGRYDGYNSTTVQHFESSFFSRTEKCCIQLFSRNKLWKLRVDLKCRKMAEMAKNAHFFAISLNIDIEFDIKKYRNSI